MEQRNSEEHKDGKNIINNKIPKEDERKKIIGNIIKKSIQCSKSTISLTSKI